MSNKQRVLRKKTIEKSKQISEKLYDPFQNFEGSAYELFIAKTFYYIRNNLKVFLILSTFIVVIVMSLLSYKIYIERLEHKALIEFEALQKNPIMTPGAGDINVAIAKLDAYTKEFNLESAKKRAITKKIELYNYNKDYENLAIQYEELANLVKQPELKIYCYYNAAINFENAKKFSRALSNLETVSKYPINDTIILANIFYTQIRLLFNLGKKQDAQKLAEKLLELDDPTKPELKDIQLKVITFLIKNS